MDMPPIKLEKEQIISLKALMEILWPQLTWAEQHAFNRMIKRVEPFEDEDIQSHEHDGQGSLSDLQNGE
jgi:hypothetical protein